MEGGEEGPELGCVGRRRTGRALGLGGPEAFRA